jgi:hypothetical protein
VPNQNLISKLKRRIEKRLMPRGRRRLRDDTSVPAFFEQLNNKGCRYAVLRWFDKLPQVAPGEDLDILVGDDDVGFVSSLLTIRGTGRGTPCDLYSVSGLPGTAFRSLPYYPPHVAKDILRRAVRHSSGAWVPCPEDHFHSLAYHALYHKGAPSGLPEQPDVAPAEGAPEHEYTSVLRQLADAIGVRVGIDFQSLDAYLAAKGWRPALDMLAKLGERNAWCRQLAEAELERQPVVPGLSAFLVREAAADPGDVARIRQIIEEDGFVLLHEQRLQDAEKQRAARAVRGGTWGPGPFPMPGGVPAVLLAAVDVFPQAPSAKLTQQHAQADNAHIFDTKLRVRRWWNGRLPPQRHCNVIHASDNARHAAHYIEVAAPNDLASVLEQARAELALLEVSSDTVVRGLGGLARRAKVELIRDPDGTLLVKKTFRPHRRRYLERELHALRTLGQSDPYEVIPSLLRVTESSYTVPYYEPRAPDTSAKLRYAAELWPLPIVQRVFGAARHFHSSGFDFLDFAPRNVILASSGEVKFIDFEFVFEITTSPRPNFAESQTLHGARRDWTGDKPLVDQNRWYERRWLPVTGLSLETLLGDDAEKQQRERDRFVLRREVNTRYKQARKFLLGR